MKLEKFLLKQKEFENSKKELFNELLELKKVYPYYLCGIDKSIIINNVILEKSAIPTINFYKIEVVSYGEVFYIKIPSNINYIKTLEYDILRSELLSRINCFRKADLSNKKDSDLYKRIIEDVKYLKKHYMNMYKKETNIFKDEILYLYNIKTCKDNNNR